MENKNILYVISGDFDFKTSHSSQYNQFKEKLAVFGFYEKGLFAGVKKGALVTISDVRFGTATFKVMKLQKQWAVAERVAYKMVLKMVNLLSYNCTETQTLSASVSLEEGVRTVTMKKYPSTFTNGTF